MKRLAQLEVKDLEEIYELTYKYGWLSAIEREEGGWLPDRAYMEKAKIEGEMLPKIDYALGEMIDAYEKWLSDHTEEGWTNMQRNLIDELGYPDFPIHWNIDIIDKMYEAVVSGLVSGLGYDEREWLIENEDPDSLIETYGEQLLRDYAQSLTESEKEPLLERIEEAAYDSTEIKEIMDDLGFDIYTIIEKMIEDGWTIEEHLRDIYSPEDLITIFGRDAIDWDIILKDAYRQYLDNFIGLEEEIAEIEKVEGQMREVLENGDLSEKIIVFQVGLTTAHHHGEMIEHILEDISAGTGEGQEVLDALSEKSREDTKEWDRYIERLIGRPLYYEEGVTNA